MKDINSSFPTRQRDPKLFEFLRVWSAKDGQHISVLLSAFDDPVYWGMMLADIVCHVANALEERFGIDQRGTRKRIQEGFEAEMTHPTSKVKGRFLE